MNCFPIFWVMMFLSFSVHASPRPTDIIENIHVDQFGYRLTDQKIAVIGSSQAGYYGSPYLPGIGIGQYQVRRWEDDVVVYSGTLSVWNGGRTQAQSGDKAWWFDFSSLSTPGYYYIYDVATGKASYKFRIDDQVYKEVLKQAVRTYFYLRCGASKTMPYAGQGWTDAACHVGSLQDKDCRLYNNNNDSMSRNLSGGWHDAGDYNKYVGFTIGALTDLLLAYQENPQIWTDDFNIPESGNGMPDILDEVKYELDWLLRMQQSDGSVLSIVGEAKNSPSGSPPSKDMGPRIYGPATTNASLVMAAVCALAAIQFNTAGDIHYATILKSAAIRAYQWAQANPSVVFYNTGVVGAGEQEVGADSYELFSRQLMASIYLYKLTGNTTFKDYVENNYQRAHLLLRGVAYPFETAEQDALLNYAALPGATAVVRNKIIHAYSSSVDSTNEDNLPSYLNKTDAYRAYLSDQNYTWGSNCVKSHEGLMFTDMVCYNLNAANNTDYLNAASGYLHYLHGVNPTGFCYLSNMVAFGAEKSVLAFYNSWFCHGSALWDRTGVSTYGPAPGFVPGGPNAHYKMGCKASNSYLCDPTLVTPPLGQPIQKSFKDFNNNWPQDSWEITENGIYYQAAYIRLLSCFIKAY
jgi:endoglucanase